MRKSDIIVIGGGLAGVTSAYELAERGHSVELLEAREGVALETSYANGSMLTASMSDPWNSPGVHRHLWASLFDPHSAMKLRLHAVPTLLSWGCKFLRNSSPTRYRAATRANYILAKYSLELTAALRARLKLVYDASTRGTMKVFRDEAAMQGPAALARLLSEHGLRHELCDRDRAIALEPQLAGIRDQIAGALHFPDDESGDAHLFCRALTDAFVAVGGRLHTRVTVERLESDNYGTIRVWTNTDVIEASRVVVAAGNSSARLLRDVGVAVPIRPAKGYSVTVDVPDDEIRPGIAVIDDAMHAAVVPLGTKVRVAGTAEFAGDDRTLRADRIDNLFNLLGALYPNIASRIDKQAASCWTGLRPMSADGLPFIGATTARGVYVNAGHGHLGWTLAAGAAGLLADLMSGTRPAIDPEPYRARR